MKVGVNTFVRRQTECSRFSHFEGSFEQVAELAGHHMYHPCMRQGYRDGVLEVDVPSTGFFAGVVQLQPGYKLCGKYEARRKGEEPRKHCGVAVGGGAKLPAKAVTLVLYRHDVLVAQKEHSTDDCEWELVSINARPTEGPEPINPDALMANHFGLDGGTPTNMTDTEFVTALREAVLYWRDKAMLEV